MSFSWGEVTRWRASTLDAAATSLTTSRDDLVECNDELVTMGTPAHWTGDAAETARAYRAHREQRLEQVRRAVAELGPAATEREVVEGGVPREVGEVGGLAPRRRDPPVEPVETGVVGGVVPGALEVLAQPGALGTDAHQEPLPAVGGV